MGDGPDEHGRPPAIPEKQGASFLSLHRNGTASEVRLTGPTEFVCTAIRRFDAEPEIIVSKDAPTARIGDQPRKRFNRLANALLLLPALYGVILAAVAVWKYRTGAVNSVGNAYTQAATGLALTVAFIAARWLSTPAKARLLLLVGSTGIGLLAIECTLAYLQRPLAFATQEGATAFRMSAARKLGQDFDARTKRELVEALRSKGIAAVPAFHPEHFFLRATSIRIGNNDVIPPGGVANSPTVFCNESGAYLVFDSDEHGFNNPKGLYVPGKLDAVVLGDSFAEGACICSNTNLVSCLREKHPRTLNLGNAGDGPLSELATLAEYAEPLRPGAVLWCYYEGNDLLDLSREKRSVLLRYLKEPNYSAGLLSRQADIDRELTRIIETELSTAKAHAGGDSMQTGDAAFTASSVLTLGRVRSGIGKLLRWRGADSFPQSEEVPLLKEVLQAAKERTERGGGRLYFVYLPAYERYGGRGYSDKPYTRVKQIVTELGVPFIDVRQAFDRHADVLGLFPFRVWGHYTEEGYRLAAETCLQTLDAPRNPAGEASAASSSE
jgi:hypothetical protein